MVTAILFFATAGCGNAGSQAQAGFGAVDDVFKSLSRVADDAGRLARDKGQAAELNRLSGQLDDLLKRVPASNTLSSADRAAVQRATEQARLARDIAKALGVSDQIAGLISKDSVDIVQASRRALTTGMTPALQLRLQTATQKVLKETTCQLMLSQIPRKTSGLSATAPAGSPSYRPLQPPTALNVYRDLEAQIGQVDQALSEARKYVDLSSAVGKLLTKSSGYVSKVKNTMTAASWDNVGAFRVYMQLCVLKN